MALTGRMSNTRTTSSGLTGRMAPSNSLEKKPLTNNEILSLGRGPLRQDVASQMVSGNPSLLKSIRKPETISRVTVPEKKDVLGEMAKAAFNNAKETIDNATQKLVDLIDVSGSGYNLKDYQKLALERKPGETNEQAASRIGVKKVTPLNRAVGAGRSTVATAGIAFLPVTAQLEAAKKAPGVLALPAKIADGIFTDLGRLGSYTLTKGVENLQVSNETKNELKPLAEELGAFVGILVGMKAAHTVGAKGLNLEKTKLSEKTKTKISNAAQFATGISVTPFSTAYGLINARIAFKVAQKQEKGIEVTPEVGRKIIEEVKQEFIDKPLPDIKTKQPEFVFEKPVEIPRAPEMITTAEKPLYEEAKKYKSAEEFVKAQEQIPFSQSFSMTNKLTKGTSDLFEPSKTSIFHGTDPLNVEKIISSGELTPKISKFDNAREKVVSLSKNRNIAETQGGQIVFEIKNSKVKTRPAPSGVVKGEGIVVGFEVRSDKSIKLSDIETAHIHLKKGETLDTPIKELIRIDRFGNTKLVDVDTYRGIKEKLEKAGVKVNILDENISKSQLIDIWNKANKIQEDKTTPETKTSGVARSIEAKAIEDKLIEGAENLKGYDSRNFKEEAKKTADLFNTDIEKARAIIRGEEPTDIRAGALIAGAEQYAKLHPNEAGDIIQELANSPLTSTISEGASEMTFARMREKESAAYQLSEVKKSYEKKVINLPKKKTTFKKELKEETEKFNLSKEELSFNKFLDKIIC